MRLLNVEQAGLVKPALETEATHTLIHSFTRSVISHTSTVVSSPLESCYVSARSLVTARKTLIQQRKVGGSLPLLGVAMVNHGPLMTSMYHRGNSESTYSEFTEPTPNQQTGN